MKRLYLFLFPIILAFQPAAPISEAPPGFKPSPASDLLQKAELLIQTMPDSALTILQQCRGQVGDLANDAISARFHYLIGQAQFEKGYYTLALKNYFASLSFSNKIHDEAQEALLNLRIGFTHKNLNELWKAEEFYLKALKYYRTTNDSLGSAELYNRLGILYAQRRESSKAFDFLQQALLIDSALKDSLHLARTLNNLGHACNLFAQLIISERVTHRFR